jgi:transcription elongation factor Elf1|tara:strand:- start:6527 stop:6718 length:192 start_codon:yes stop_codon:yes gene_type:complete
MNIKTLRKIIPELDMALHINKSNCQKLDWYDDFVDYIQEININIYNEACEYADKKQENENDNN